jgi:dihydroorotase
VTKGSLGEELAEIGEMRQAGIVAISDDGHPIQNAQLMRARAGMRACSISVIDHCEDAVLSPADA